jgi:aldose 1-epimerase
VEFVPNFPDRTAIHGLVASRPWQLGDDGSFEIRWDGGSPAWPWAFALRLAAEVHDEVLALDYRLTNLADAPMPAGVGLHPWFRGPIELRIPAGAAYESNTSSSAQPRAVTGPHDLRSLAAPATGLDGTWTALRERRIDLAWPSLGVRGRLDMHSSAASLVAVASPEAMGAVAVEPQTHGPDPFRRLEQGEPDAPILLSPRTELQLGLRLALDLAPDLRETEGVWSNP